MSMEQLRVFVSGMSGTQKEFASLERHGMEVIFGRPLTRLVERPYTEVELGDICRGVDVLVYSVADVVSRRVLGSSERLRLVTAPFVGFDNVDLAAATDHGVAVANSPSRENVIGMAEATIGLMLALLKRLPHIESRLRTGAWGTRDDRGSMMAGATIGLVGLGRISREIVERLSPWDLTIVAHDPYVAPDVAANLGVELLDMEGLCSRADVVSLHAVLNEETRGMIGAPQLRSMKRSAYLINAARGELVDEDALAAALHEGQIGGAALDTFAVEPLPMDSPLRNIPRERLILTPHIVGHTEAGRVANLRVCLRNVEEAAKGRLPDNVVNPEVVPRWMERFGDGNA